jgi:MFS family permease
MPTPTVPSDRGGLWSPDRRALTIGLILTVTIVASESLAVATIMPIVADDLAAGSRALYGWVFSGFLLGSLVGIVLAGLLIDRASSRPICSGSPCSPSVSSSAGSLRRWKSSSPAASSRASGRGRSRPWPTSRSEGRSQNACGR